MYSAPVGTLPPREYAYGSLPETWTTGVGGTMPVWEDASCALNAEPTSAACHSLGNWVGTPDGLAQPSTVTISHVTVLPATTSRPDRAAQSRVKLDTTEGTTRKDAVMFVYSRMKLPRTMTVTLCRPASQVAKSMNHSAGPPYQADGDRSSSGGTSTKHRAVLLRHALHQAGKVPQKLKGEPHHRQAPALVQLSESGWRSLEENDD